MPVSGSDNQTAQSKSVAFDLDSDVSSQTRPDPGYETDDSDSTIDLPHPHRDRHRGRHSSSLPPSVIPQSRHSCSEDRRASSASRPRNSTEESQAHQGSESDSTIDLPNRFDSHGRLLPEKDPAAEKFEDFMKKFTRVLI